ncbi:unnamed protein product [Choristocarpus tenellus]
MDTLLGICGPDFVIVAADAQVAKSILLYQTNLDKVKPLNDSIIMASAGPQSDCCTFTEYIQKNLALYELNNDLQLTTKAAAHFVRGELARALRKGPFQTQLLLGGMDKGVSSLFWIDYLGSMTKVPYGAHGYGSYFTYSVFDQEYKKNLTQEEALSIIQKCIYELHTRFFISQKNFVIKIVTAEGIKVLCEPEREGVAAGAESQSTPMVAA